MNEKPHQPVAVRNGKVYCPTCNMMCGLVQPTPPEYPEPPPCSFGGECPAVIDLRKKGMIECSKESSPADKKA